MYTDNLTVLMAVYNGELFVHTAVQSILKQTHKDFRFLIVDDCSTDRTREIIRSFNDPRIELICLEQNVGQTRALTIGVEQIATPWIARMDADDYAAPTRLQDQLDTIGSDSQLGCVGTLAWAFKTNPNLPETFLIRPSCDKTIRRVLLWESPMIHGSIIVSRDAMRKAGGYDSSYRYSADLDLYDRLLAHCKAANVQKPLMGLRRHPGQASLSKVSVDEAVRIFGRRLSDSRYTPEEIGFLKSARSMWYLREAYEQAKDRRYGKTLVKLLHSVRLSPATPVTYLFPRSTRQQYSIQKWHFGERSWRVSDGR